MDASIMNDQLFQLLIALFLFALGVIQTLSFMRQKENSKWREEQVEWMRKLDDKSISHGETLIRIETRLENYSELKKDFDHDHKAIRDLDKLLDKTILKVDEHEKALIRISERCDLFHMKGAE